MLGQDLFGQLNVFQLLFQGLDVEFQPIAEEPLLALPECVQRFRRLGRELANQLDALAQRLELRIVGTVFLHELLLLLQEWQ